jgi:hypothetical protein
VLPLHHPRTARTSQARNRYYIDKG